MTQTTSARMVQWLEGVVLVVAGLFLFVHTMPRAWKTLNTDFPNYYTAARLAHEGFDTARMYEWQWIEREKDHRAIDIRVMGLLPITPFSTLAVYPLAGLAPLTAKHVWIVLNLACLIPLAWMLHAITGLALRRVAIVILLSFPLHRNLLYGQFYVVLLLLLVAACACYLRGRRATAGVLVALAAACKVFPVLLFVLFLQRRDWRALLAGLATLAASLVVSVGVFGLNAHRTWLQEILPWVMRGEGLGTYTTTASIAGVLHVLFLAEPQWHPHPWHASVLIYAMLAPTLQMLALAPAILLIRRGDNRATQLLLEWSALLAASLAISTIPASYNFVVMVFPVCVLAAQLLRKGRYGWLVALLVAYLGIGFPLPVPANPAGLSILLYVPRLPLMCAVLVGIYGMLQRDRTLPSHRDWTRFAWAAGMLAATVVSIHSTWRIERAMRQEYAYRLPIQEQGFLNAQPQADGGILRYSAFLFEGYQLLAHGGATEAGDVPSPVDVLSFTSQAHQVLLERAAFPASIITDEQYPAHIYATGGRDPMLSANGIDLAYIHDDHGRGQLVLRRNYQSGAADTPLTAPRQNVYEASLHASDDYAYAATEGGSMPAIYIHDATQANALILPAPARYPAISPNGQWMAYSRLQHGVWNLWLRNQQSGETRRIADVPCNQVQPSWEDDRTLLYGTDCGRSIWFTAIARRRVLP